jgi:hypothetical protein
MVQHRDPSGLSGVGINGIMWVVFRILRAFVHWYTSLISPWSSVMRPWSSVLGRSSLVLAPWFASAWRAWTGTGGRVVQVGVFMDRVSVRWRERRSVRGAKLDNRWSSSICAYADERRAKRLEHKGPGENERKWVGERRESCLLRRRGGRAAAYLSIISSNRASLGNFPSFPCTCDRIDRWARQNPFNRKCVTGAGRAGGCRTG